MRVYILGGGPTGLALAQGLAENGMEFTLVESSAQLGGLAKTVDWDGAGRHDLGPHKIFSQDEKLVQRVKNLLPEGSWIKQKKVAKIYLNGQFLDYPPSPLKLGKIFGIFDFVRMVVGYLFALLFKSVRSEKANSFEEDLIARVGTPLYKCLFRDLAFKLWGDPKGLDAKLSRGRVQTPSFFELILTTLGIRKSSKFEALEFEYPSNGLQTIWEAIHKNTSKFGVFKMATSVVDMDFDDKGFVSKIQLFNHSSGKKEAISVGQNDHVISTLPLKLTTKICGDQFDKADTRKLDQVVVLNDLYLVFLLVDIGAVFDESWIFVADKNIAFHRVSEQKSFDPGMTLNGSIVCCEVMNTAEKGLERFSEKELIAKCVADLNKLSGKKFKIQKQRLIKLNKSYPVYLTGYEASLQELLKNLDNFKNFKSIGRQGAFNYIGTLDAMDIGYGAAKWLVEQGENWEDERVRTSHYPVLD